MARKRKPEPFLMDGIDCSAAPQFSVMEVAKVFFDMTDHNIRWHERKEHFFLDDVEVGARRYAKTNFRYYTLDGVEKMAHALLQHGVITPHKFKAIVGAVEAVAKVYGYIDPPPPEIEDEPVEK